MPDPLLLLLLHLLVLPTTDCLLCYDCYLGPEGRCSSLTDLGRVVDCARSDRRPRTGSRPYQHCYVGWERTRWGVFYNRGCSVDFGEKICFIIIIIILY